MRRIVPLLLLALVPACLWAADFGLALDQEAGAAGIGSESAFDYLATLTPDFSSSLGGLGDLYISAGFTASYEDEEWSFIPELMHTELSLRFNNIKLRAGRIPYADPLDFVLEGFFDGAQVLYDTAIGTFNAGAWYTGLLYKKSANITMTAQEEGSYYNLLDYNDFSDTYFASRRMIMAAGWEHPAVAEVIRLRAALTGQVDLNGADYPYNSVYVSGKALMPFNGFIFKAGLCMEIARYLNDTGAGFAWEWGASWAPPTPFASRFSLDWRYSTGHSDNIEAFVPITTKAQGDILEAKLSALMAFVLDYTAQLHPNFSASLSNSYFIRTDLGTYRGIYPVYETVNKDYFLGIELFGRFIWRPLSDLGVNLGGGVFLPSSGFSAGPKWRVELGLALILY